MSYHTGHELDDTIFKQINQDRHNLQVRTMNEEIIAELERQKEAINKNLKFFRKQQKDWLNKK